MRISDWSSDVCSSDLHAIDREIEIGIVEHDEGRIAAQFHREFLHRARALAHQQRTDARRPGERQEANVGAAGQHRSEEHTSELQSLMRISYAVFCLNKNKDTITRTRACSERM